MQERIHNHRLLLTPFQVAYRLNSPRKPHRQKKVLSVESQGPTVIVYRIAGWDQDRAEKAFGKPTKIAKKKEDFVRSINEPSMNDHLDAEVEQWLVPAKIGLMRTIITFDGNGKAVRAICEWSDY
jgi:hypothetical protein